MEHRFVLGTSSTGHVHETLFRAQPLVQNLRPVRETLFRGRPCTRTEHDFIFGPLTEGPCQASSCDRRVLRQGVRKSGLPNDTEVHKTGPRADPRGLTTPTTRFALRANLATGARNRIEIRRSPAPRNDYVTTFRPGQKIGDASSETADVTTLSSM